jgi:hypothetical protein
VTNAEGKAFLDHEMVTVYVHEHPDLSGLRDAMKSAGIDLVADPATGRGGMTATAATQFVRVTGPDGAAFSRAVIKYNDKAVLQDVWHELNHVLDYQTGKIPPALAITAADAAQFADLNGRSGPDLVARALAGVSRRPLLESAQAQARRWVAELRNHLRDLEEVPKARGTAYAENSEKAARGLSRGILETMVTTGQVPGYGILDAAGRQQIKLYIRAFMDSTYPELRAAYQAVFPRQAAGDFKFLD